MKIRKIVLYAVIAAFALLTLVGCGTIANYAELSSNKAITSSPSGATFTVYDNKGNVIEQPQAALFTLFNNYETRLEPRDRMLYDVNRRISFMAVPASNGIDFMLFDSAGVPLVSHPDIPLFDRYCAPVEVLNSERAGLEILNKTPQTVKWEQNYSHITFDMRGHQPQTARIEKDRLNPLYWLNFVGIGAGLAVFATNGTSEEGLTGLGVFALSGLSLFVDIKLGNTKQYASGVHADFRE